MAPQDLDFSFTSVEAMVQNLKALGCDQAFVKLLSPRQDNNKNQIYLGSSPAVMDFFPGTTTFRGPSTSNAKSGSEAGKPIAELSLEFSWIWPDGQSYDAPRTRIINYHQYPNEIRLSGFLTGCLRPPRALHRDHHHDNAEAYGHRVLVLGIAGDHVYGTVVTDRDGSSLVERFRDLPEWPVSSVLRLLRIPGSETAFAPSRLRTEVEALLGVQHEACALHDPDVGPVPQRSSRGGGLTLEALLGVPMNAVSGPDKHGFEIKAVGSDKVTLITTEPNLGFRHQQGLNAYLERFGWPAKTHPDRRVFNGAHKYGEVNSSSGAVLTMTGWDSASGQPTGGRDPEVHLIDPASDALISGWTYDHLKVHWSTKHAGALYVETRGVKKDSGRYPTHYVYGPRYCLGVGTSPMYLFRQIVNQRVVLDPADERYASGKLHARTQWRMPGTMNRPSIPPWKLTSLPARLAHLYDAFEVRDTDTRTSFRFQNGLYAPA